MEMSSRWLREKLRAAGSNQTELAEGIQASTGKVKYDQPYVSKVFSGRERGSEEFITVAAKLLNVGAGDLRSILSDTHESLHRQMMALAPDEFYDMFATYLLDHAAPGMQLDWTEKDGWFFAPRRGGDKVKVSDALILRAKQSTTARMSRKYPKDVLQKFIKENNILDDEQLARSTGGVAPESHRSGLADNVMGPPDIHIESDNLVGEKDLPIYASAYAGPTGMKITYDPIDYVKRPAPLANTSDGYGVHVVGDSMEPKYQSGDLVLIHPGRPPRRGDSVFVVLEDLDGGCSAMIKNLVSMNEEGVTLEQYNPAKQFRIEASKIKNVHLIVGAYNAPR